ncbi:MAG TPA: DUF951 domain-containing protein [Armatimonadetes bacterium]|nr:DUF951 domain-containing protein [Armatimonadota bacterium]
MAESPSLREGLVVSLKKPHPCGANAWEIMRLGMDVKLRCRGCGQIVRLPRKRMERRVRAIIEEEAGGNQQT